MLTQIGHPIINDSTYASCDGMNSILERIAFEQDGQAFANEPPDVWIPFAEFALSISACPRIGKLVLLAQWDLDSLIFSSEVKEVASHIEFCNFGNCIVNSERCSVSKHQSRRYGSHGQFRHSFFC